MSYCRFSSNDFQCDLYVYESEEGYVVSVAANRVELLTTLPELGDEPDHETSTEDERRAFVNQIVARHTAVMQALDDPDKHRRTAIDLEYAGETQVFDGPKEAGEFIQKLRELGYRFPDYVLEALAVEAIDLEDIEYEHKH